MLGIIMNSGGASSSSAHAAATCRNLDSRWFTVPHIFVHSHLLLLLLTTHTLWHTHTLSHTRLFTHNIVTQNSFTHKPILYSIVTHNSFTYMNHKLWLFLHFLVFLHVQCNSHQHMFAGLWWWISKCPSVHSWKAWQPMSYNSQRMSDNKFCCSLFFFPCDVLNVTCGMLCFESSCLVFNVCPVVWLKVLAWFVACCVCEKFLLDLQCDVAFCVCESLVLVLPSLCWNLSGVLDRFQVVDGNNWTWRFFSLPRPVLRPHC
jgi:hypothetical protein